MAVSVLLVAVKQAGRQLFPLCDHDYSTTTVADTIAGLASAIDSLLYLLINLVFERFQLSS